MLNSVFHHVDFSCIIYSDKRIKYEIKEKNPGWLNKGPWYNTAVFYKFHGTVFEDFIINAKNTDTILFVI